jgi:2OG-Fe(II) oxygenase superfamily
MMECSGRQLLREDLRDFVSPSVLGNVPDLARRYRNAQPYPHIVIDGFLQPAIIEHIIGNFPSMEQMPTIFREPMSYKGQLSDIDGKWPRFSGIFAALQSKPFRDLLTEITAIEDLQEDTILAGGGLHQSPKSGFLDIHVDANFHPDNKTLHRRLNILIYANPSWRPQWGGQLQLWSNENNKPKGIQHSIDPMSNRAVIFSTTRTSWHGVTPITCPEDKARRSLALYYYTKTRPGEELYKDSSVIWMNRSIWWKRALYPTMNRGIAILKPYAKRLRHILRRDKFFDASQK